MNRLALLRTCAALAAIFPATGCDPSPVEEDLKLRVSGGTLTLDSDCSGGCGGDVLLEVSLDYQDDQRLDEETVELEQYRVDYALDGVKDDVPYFAGRQGILLAPGDGADFTLVVVGERQRAFVQEAIEDEALRGSATLTLAGYDWNNAQVFIEAEFDVRFEDLPPRTPGGAETVTPRAIAGEVDGDDAEADDASE